MTKKEIAAQMVDPNVDYAKAFHEECKASQRAADKRKHRVSLDEIKERVSVLDVWGKYTKPHKYYGHYLGLCPICNNEELSLHIYPKRGIWYCHKCGVGGDVFSVIMEVEDKTLHEASDFLYENYVLNAKTA